MDIRRGRLLGIRRSGIRSIIRLSFSLVGDGVTANTAQQTAMGVGERCLSLILVYLCAEARHLVCLIDGRDIWEGGQGTNKLRMEDIS